MNTLGDERLATTEGYFSPDSMIQRIHSKRMVAVGGPRAILLQAAHPLVMAGLEHHSEKIDEFRSRLVRTANLMEVVVFGSRAQADAVVQWIEEGHKKVRGQISAPRGDFSGGTRYSAMNPSLKMWVVYTMCDSAMVAHERMVRPLSTAERSGMWDDWRQIGRLFGLRDTHMPKTYDDFVAYGQEMLADGPLAVSDVARELVPRAVFEFPVPRRFRPVQRAFRQLSAGLLPPKVRTAFGLDAPLPVRAIGLPAARGMSRLAHRVLPDEMLEARVDAGELDRAVQGLHSGAEERREIADQLGRMIHG